MNKNVCFAIVIALIGLGQIGNAWALERGELRECAAQLDTAARALRQPDAQKASGHFGGSIEKLKRCCNALQANNRLVGAGAVQDMKRAICRQASNLK